MMKILCFGASSGAVGVGGDWVQFVWRADSLWPLVCLTRHRRNL
jgi:hypothetical protein